MKVFSLFKTWPHIRSHPSFTLDAFETEPRWTYVQHAHLSSISRSNSGTLLMKSY